MRRGAVVIVALVALLVVVLAVVQKLPVSEYTKQSITRKLIWAFSLAAAAAMAVVGVMGLPVWAAFAASAGVLVLTGAYTLVADLVGLPGGTPRPGSGDRGGSDLPDPCIVGPYWAGGRAYLCNR